MGENYTISHAACLCAQLPVESRTVKAYMTPEQADAALWTLPVRVAIAQLNELRVIRWLSTQDAVEGKNYPDQILPPEVRNAPPSEPDPEGYKAALAEIRARINESNGGDERCQEQ